MPSVVLSPLPIQRFVDNNGNALVGGLLFTYLAGTTTKTNTYTDSTGSTANTNPVVLNARGEANVWLTPGAAYKFTLSPPTWTDPPTNPIWTVDNIIASGAETFASIAALRANTTTAIDPNIVVLAYYLGGLTGGGPFVYNPADTTSADNGGTIIVDAIGQRWDRQLNGQTYNVQWFGAKGDSNLATDDSVPINAAITTAFNVSKDVSTIGVFIPDPAPQSNGANGFYNCKSPLLRYWTTHLFGAGMWTTQLNFPMDTNGIEVAGAPKTTRRGQVHDLYLIGNGPLSTVATKTLGFHALDEVYGSIYNLVINDFVDGIVFEDATGPMLNHNVLVYESDYPNQINGYPRYLSRLTGTVPLGKAQGIYLHACQVWGNTLASSIEFTGNGIQVQFDYTTGNFNSNWGARSGKGGIFQQSGIKVDVFPTGGGPMDRQVCGVDYSLYDITTGSPVLISPGAQYVGAKQIRVIFVTAPTSGYTIRILWSDPTAACGVYLDFSNLNVIDVTVSGCITGYLDTLGNNYFTPWCGTSQICDTLFSIGGPDNVYQVTQQSNSTIDVDFSQGSGGIFPAGMAQGCGRDWLEEVRGTPFSTSSATYVTIGFEHAQLTFTERTSGNREVMFEGGYSLSNTGGGDAQADIIINVSYDNGATYAPIAFQRIEDNVSASAPLQDRVSMTVRDTANMQPLAGNRFNILYQVQTRLNAGTSITWEGGGAGSELFLRARSVNPN